MTGFRAARRARGSSGEAGLTLIELVVTAALLAILAAAAMPLYEVSIKRGREIELRMALRTIRRAIDDFHKSYCASGGATDIGAGVNTCIGIVPQTPTGGGGGGGGKVQGQGAAYEQVPLIDVSEFDPETRGYPPQLAVLVEGVQPSGGGTDEDSRLRFLRRIPLDPMIAHDTIDPSDENFGWGLRSYQDRPPANDKCEYRVWGRQNVYDVYTKSTAKALDGSYYCTW